MFYLYAALFVALSPWTLKADHCPICLANFHDRSGAPVIVKTQCCGQRFDLDCLSMCFFDQPIGARRCAMCRQNPMPVVNQNTSESHPDTFFPDQTFYLACFNGDLEQVERSLAEGVNVNAVMIGGFTALILASLWGHTEVVEHLINAGANPDTANTLSNNATALIFAADCGNTLCVKSLINAGANLNTSRTKGGATPLIIAAEENKVDCVKLLIKAGANLNARVEDGVTSLYIAAGLGNTDCVKLLIRAGANLNAALPDGTTPLGIATKMGNTDCVKLLTNAGAEFGTEAEKETNERR